MVKANTPTVALPVAVMEHGSDPQPRCVGQRPLTYRARIARVVRQSSSREGKLLLTQPWATSHTSALAGLPGTVSPWAPPIVARLTPTIGRGGLTPRSGGAVHTHYGPPPLYNLPSTGVDEFTDIPGLDVHAVVEC